MVGMSPPAAGHGRGPGRAGVIAIVLVLLLGLYVDVAWELPGQLAASLAAWGLFLVLLERAPRAESRLLLLCLVIATAGELFLSLGWGLYTYRLDNVPLFVPPGHALLLSLGFALARRMPVRVAHAIMAAAALYSLGAAATGADTFGLVLCAVFIGCSLASPQRKTLFASTFVLSLALELYGTWLGNWYWAAQVPFTPLTTTNPPLAAGAFYCVLDLLVVAAASRWPVRAVLPAPAAPAPPALAVRPYNP